MFLSCLSLRPSMHPETLLTRYLAEYSIHFHHTKLTTAMHRGTEMNTSQFEVKKSKVRAVME